MSAESLRLPLLIGVSKGMLSVSDADILPSFLFKSGFSILESAALDTDEDLARRLSLLVLLPLVLLSPFFEVDVDEEEAGDVEGLDGLVFVFRLLLPLYNQSTGTSNSVLVIITKVLSPLPILALVDYCFRSF